MAKLSSAGRKALPSSQFAGPNRTFPVNDKVHERQAIRMAPRSVKAGNISPSIASKIVAKAKAKLKGK